MNIEQWFEYIDGPEEGMLQTLVRKNIECATSDMWRTAVILDVFSRSDELSGAAVVHDDRTQSHENAKSAFQTFRKRISSSLEGDSRLHHELEKGCLAGFCPKIEVEGEMTVRRVETFPSILTMFPSSDSHRIHNELADLTDDEWEWLSGFEEERDHMPSHLQRLRRSIEFYASSFTSRLPRGSAKTAGMLSSNAAHTIDTEEEEVRDPLPAQQNGDRTLWFAPCADDDFPGDNHVALDQSTSGDLVRYKGKSGLIDRRDCLRKTDGGLPQYHFAGVFVYKIDGRCAFRPSVWADGFLETFAVLPENTDCNFGLSINVSEEEYGSTGDFEVIAKAKDIEFSKDKLRFCKLGFVPVSDRNTMLPIHDHTQRIVQKRFTE